MSSLAKRDDQLERTAGLVTVVLPAYNVGPYVAEAVQSVLEQTYEMLELIVVDDGSTDDTVEQLQAIHDDRLRVIRQSNAGSSAARNTGIVAGRGEWIAFIDGDDVWLPQKLERHVAYLRARPDADLTFAWSRVVDERGRDTGRTSVHAAGVVSFERLFAQNVIGNGSAVVLRRSALDAGGAFRRSATRRGGARRLVARSVVATRQRARHSRDAVAVPDARGSDHEGLAAHGDGVVASRGKDACARAGARCADHG